MVKIIIDDKEYEVQEGKNLLEACLSLGLDLPYFCWHPAMGSVGSCRQCAVVKYKDENDKHGRLVMSCMEPVSDGTRISLKDTESVQFRAGVIEWLMTNHPHDCPICDEGGECHLQDMTVMTGHSYRRYSFNKRTYENQNLGPFINHEMNRCIQCYRCVRFYKDYAGGRDFNAFAVHNNVYFGRYEDGTLENEFSGNLVEVCPTGVFTDKTLKQHYTRKWDLTDAPSICHNCSLGCNIIAAERYGKLRRILSRYNGEVNGYFICDRGRFGYEYVNSDKRIKQPLLTNASTNKLEQTDKESILNYFKNNFSKDNRTIGIGSPRGSLESNFSLMTFVGKENFYMGLNEVELKLISEIKNILQNSRVKTPSLKETENADAVLILGEDLTNTAPMLALVMRQAVRNQPKDIIGKMGIPNWNDAAVREIIQDEKGPFFIASPSKTKLDEIATKTFRSSPEDIARIGFSIANSLNGKSPAIDDLSEEEKDFVQEAAKALSSAKNPLIISGTSLFSEHVIHSAANVAWALHSINKETKICYTVPEVNSLGISFLANKNLNEAFKEAEQGKLNNIIILENDLYRREVKDKVDVFFDKCKNIFVLDFIENQTTEKATAVIPSGTFAESDGTVVNNEGRAQRFYQVYQPEGDIFESWRWIKFLGDSAEEKVMHELTNFDEVTNELVKEFPEFDGIQNLAPPSDYRIAGQKIPREPHRFSGRTAMHANKNVSEAKPPDDSDSALSFTMEGFRGQPPSSVIPFFWSPGWNSAQSINKYQIEVGGHLHDGDPGKRLIEPGENNIQFFKDIPEKFAAKDSEWLLVPVYHIYGSDELSSNSKAVIERITEASITINPDDAGKLNLKKDDEVEISIGNSKFNLPVKLSLDFPKGMIGIPKGLKNVPYINYLQWCKLSKVNK